MAKTIMKIETESTQVFVKRGPGRPPKHPRPLEVVQPRPPVPPSVPELPVRVGPRPVGRPPKHPRPVPLVKTNDEKKRSAPNSPKLSPPKKLKADNPMKSSRSAVETKTPNSVLEETNNQYVFSPSRPSNEQAQWWRKPVGLQVIDCEDELTTSLQRLKDSSDKRRNELLATLGPRENRLAESVAVLVYDI